MVKVQVSLCNNGVVMFTTFNNSKHRGKKSTC